VSELYTNKQILKLKIKNK